MLDARGLVCPMPVVMVQKEIRAAAPDTLDILVDDRCAVENITRFARNHGYTIAVAEQGREFHLTLTKA